MNEMVSAQTPEQNPFWICYLKECNRIKDHIKYSMNPVCLDNLRDRPEFKKIADAVESKYLAEHERVQRWLEENEMI